MYKRTLSVNVSAWKCATEPAFDEGTFVADYGADSNFNGVIKKVTITQNK